MIRIRFSKAGSCTLGDDLDTEGFTVAIQLFGRVLLELWITAR